MVNLGLPFMGWAWYFYQTHRSGTPGSGTNLAYEDNVTDGDNTNYISGKIQDVRIGVGDKHEEIWGIDSQCACNLHELVSDFTMHLEYYIQVSDTLLDRLVDRTARCSFQTLAFCLITNKCLPAAAAIQKTAYIMNGCKPKNVRVSAAFNQLYLVTADFSVRDILSDGQTGFPTGADTDGVGSDPTAFTGGGSTYCGFHLAGSIEKDGADVAHIVDGIDLTFDHGLIDKFDHDSKAKQYCIEGRESVTGTIDVSLNDGGGFHWGEVLSQKEFQIVIDLGAHAARRITLTYCRWKNSEQDINVSDEPLMESAPFTCHPSDQCTDGFISAVPNA